MRVVEWERTPSRGVTGDEGEVFEEGHNWR